MPLTILETELNRFLYIDKDGIIEVELYRVALKGCK
jgi:hypothetical protein